MRLLLFSVVALLLLAACGRSTTIQVSAPPGAARTPPTFPRVEARPQPVPDSSGWGTHVLAVARAPHGAVWVGTYGQGLYVSRDGAGREWENLRSGDSTSISWNFVNAVAFAPGGVWYGTIGNGWGVSRDGGRTWRNWTLDQLGPRWQYVAPDGIATAGDTVYIATADGLRISSDGGETYRDVTDRNGLPSKYLLALELNPSGSGPPAICVRHLRGVSRSEDGGRTWRSEPGEARPRKENGEGAASACGARSRRPTRSGEGDAARTGEGAAAGSERAAAAGAELDDGADSERRGARTAERESGDLLRRIREWREVFRRYPDTGGPVAQPGDVEHFWFRRPIAPEDNPYIDQTYTYGSTMGGNFQQHQGVEFNNPEGTPVHAVGDGMVAFAGKAEAGAWTVAILHDRRFRSSYVYSTYYHNVDLTVRSGQWVRAGDVIAHVGNTGRATNDHLHLEIHTTPTADSSKVVDAKERFPPYTRNPQLWIEPLPGTGAIAGRVFDSTGKPVPGARVYGVTKLEPRETPFSFAETYMDKAHPDAAFDEHCAIGDVPAGKYVLGVEVEGRRIFRKARVEPRKVTMVEFRP